MEKEIYYLRKSIDALNKSINNLNRGIDHLLESSYERSLNRPHKNARRN